MTEPTPKQAMVNLGLVRRAGLFPEMADLAGAVETLRAAGVPWEAVATLVSKWGGAVISGERLRTLYADRAEPAER